MHEMYTAMLLPKPRPHEELMAAGNEWRAWRTRSAPWYLRWRRLLWWRRPKSPELTIPEAIIFLTFDSPLVLTRLLGQGLYAAPSDVQKWPVSAGMS